MDLIQYKKLLSQYVSFQSISTDKKFQPEVAKTVNWLTQLLKSGGFKVRLLKTSGANPLVFGSITISPKVSTVLVYGHYDVQPAQKEDGWQTDPFQLSEKSGRLFGRGVMDNKGQNLIHIGTVLQLIKQKRLRYNVKFLLEGDEETGSTQMDKLLRQNKRLLRADYVLVSDGEIVRDNPTIEASLRGGFNLTLTYITGKNNLHSGIFGGAVPSAPHELTKFLSKIYDSKNKVAVPGFYNNVDKITPSQIKNNKSISPLKEILSVAGVKQLLPETGFDFYTQTGLRPTIQITGLKSGYIGEGYSNIVPATAEVRLNFRVVKSQDPRKVLAAFTKFVTSNTPSYVKYQIDVHGIHNPVKIDINSAKAKEVRAIMKKAYGKEPIVKYVGGAIGFVTSVKETLGVDTILASLANDDGHMHGVNENFEIDLIKKGLRFSEMFFATP